MKLSVITVCRNAATAIGRTIENVIDQSFFDKIEYVIIDGQSTDNTVEIINRYRNKVHVFISEPDKGIYDAMNKGVQRSSGDYLIFLNAGDLFIHEQVIERLYEAIRQHAADIYVGESLSVNKATGTVAVMNNPGKFDALWLFKGLLNHQSIVAKREVFLINGLFDTSYKIYADYNWYLKNYMANNCKFRFTGIGIALYERGGFSDQHYHTIGKDELVRIRKEIYGVKNFKLLSGYLTNSRYLFITRRLLWAPGVRNYINKLIFKQR